MIKKIVLYIILFYRRNLSLLKGKPTCIYIPTCSQYSYEAIEKYGLFKGGYLSIKRILRCHPFSKGGYDPLR